MYSAPFSQVVLSCWDGSMDDQGRLVSSWRPLLEPGYSGELSVCWGHRPEKDRSPLDQWLAWSIHRESWPGVSCGPGVDLPAHRRPPQPPGAALVHC
ncbi:MAG: hypothetical protein CM15mP77_0180 [Synechococcus sp.]|nr:MAG: hypothetical protein CM15mP77_0180 [Synechococcus sp.]